MLKDFETGLATHAVIYVADAPVLLSASLCVWAGPIGIYKCPEFASWTLLASI